MWVVSHFALYSYGPIVMISENNAMHQAHILCPSYVPGKVGEMV